MYGKSLLKHPKRLKLYFNSHFLVMNHSLCLPLEKDWGVFLNLKILISLLIYKFNCNRCNSVLCGKNNKAFDRTCQQAH